MNDITISAKRIRTELWWLLISFILVFCLNVYSIIRFHTPWKELLTTLHIQLLVSLILYVILLLFRGLVNLLIRFAASIKK